MRNVIFKRKENFSMSKQKIITIILALLSFILGYIHSTMDVNDTSSYSYEIVSICYIVCIIATLVSLLKLRGTKK